MAGRGVTQQASSASLPVIRALLDEASRKDYRSGVLGIQARPEWAGSPTFTHDEVTVRVAPCESALAIREAITSRVRSQWLVVLTDRPDDDLGAGILSHLIGNRLRTPDPWEAVRLRFAATGIDSALTGLASHRQIATGLLAATPVDGWPPAAAGVLTRDHALGAVTQAHLGLADPVMDLTSVLRWTVSTDINTRVGDLRELGGDVLTDAVLAWLAGRAGGIAGPLQHLLGAGEARDAVPLGLISGLLDETSRAQDSGEARLAREGLIRMEARLGGSVPASAVLVSWAAEAAAVIAELLREQNGETRGETLLGRGDELLSEAHAERVADRSDLLPAGLTGRILRLAERLRAAVRGGQQDVDPDVPQLLQADLAHIEDGWTEVATHRLAEHDPRTAPFHAAVRLSRWLAVSSAAAGERAGQVTAALIERHAGSDAWVDSAVNDASGGVSDPTLAAGLAAVLTAARSRRARHDRDFAAALAADGGSDTDGGPADAGVWYLEKLLPDAVLPLAKTAPVLLLVLDGMSAGVCTEIISSLLDRGGDGWAEALLPGQSRRAAALAALPTVTEVSRASLLSGELQTGGQDAELRGFRRLCEAHGMAGAPLFHKKPLDSARPGYAVAEGVAAAIADVPGQPLVTCVLNTIDDALDRSDPGGTDWTAATVRHLLPLLDRARHAGRAVVLTADHGHVIERRHGEQRSHPEISSGRSRSATPPAGDGEVLVTGPRVLLHGGRAVLAVDEQLRYGPLKAGYHGGAAAAEAVVPVAVLVPGAVPEGSSLRLAPPQQPAWWLDPAASRPAPAGPGTPQAKDRRADDSPAVSPAATPATDRRLRSAPGAPAQTLFDLSRPDARADQPGTTAPVGRAGHQLSPTADAVVRSAVYVAQKKIAGRLAITDDQVRHLIGALLAAPACRMTFTQAAAALAVAPLTVRGVILHAQRLLNVEGYAVLRVDADGVTVVLDEPMLREQFAIPS